MPKTRPVKKSSKKQKKNRQVNVPVLIGGNEVKYLAVAHTADCDTTAEFTLLNAVTKGTTENTRIGRNIRLLRVDIRGFTSATPATGVDQVHRHIVFFDKLPDGAAPTVGDLLLATTVYSIPNPIYAPRFRILLDRTITINATAEAGTIRQFHYVLPINAMVWYNELALGDIRDLIIGALYIMTLGTSAPGVTAGTTNFSSVIFFRDD